MYRDLRKYARQTNTHLIFGRLLLLFVLGDGLILIFYGKSAALMGLLCLGLGLVPVIAILIALWILEVIVKRSNSS
jgi:hypothetical protein